VRTRFKAPLAVVGALVLVFVLAGPAFAQESEPQFKDEAAEECHKLLEEGKSVDDCQEAPNPLVPAANEVIWGTLSFVVLLIGMWKFGLPAVRNMMHAREERIRTDLERAESAKSESEGVLQSYQSQLADARAEAGRIIEEGREAGERVRQERIAAAETDAREIIERAQADINLQRERALSELRSEVATLSIELAERIVERNLDRPTQMQLVESFIDQVARSN
jgi:F-type H+-transporting ATPase subunit b